jgi:hypothetical protein
MKKSRVVSKALNNPKAGYSQPARLEPTVVWRRSRRLQLTALEQLSKMLEAKQESTRTQKSGHYPVITFCRGARLPRPLHCLLLTAYCLLTKPPPSRPLKFLVRATFLISESSEFALDELI